MLVYLLHYSSVKRNIELLDLILIKKKIQKLKKNQSYINHIPNSLIKKNSNYFDFTNKFNEISKLNVLILCLPTPITKNNQPDLSFIKKTLKNIKKYLAEGQLLILESSTYPGSTRKYFLPILKKFKLGNNFFLGYSPEREDPNNFKFKLENIPKICSGYSINCLDLVQDLYKNILNKVVKVSGIETAEFTKLYENIYRSVNIGLVNELKIISNKLNLDIYEIIEAAKTKPFGFQAFYPGPGVGGHCIPVDPYYLSYVAKKNNINIDLINKVGEINTYMPHWIIKKMFEKSKLKKILLIGVAYKKNIDDIRESPAIDFINILTKKGVKVDFHDPFVEILKSRKLKKNYYSKKLNIDLLKKYDCSVILTNHTSVNYKKIKKYSKLIFDTRNVFKKKNSKIVQL